MIPRIHKNIGNEIVAGKVLIIYGPRRVGKTTLLQEFLKHQSGKWRYEIGEDSRLHTLFGTSDRQALEQRVEGYDGIIIDEAQDIPNIGTGLKILIDLFPQLPIIVSGSSSFEIGQYIAEPLVGRKKTLYLYPLSLSELVQNEGNVHNLTQRVPEMLIYGMYPWVHTSTSQTQKQEELSEVTHSLLFKDILRLEKIRGSETIKKLLSIVALQIGQEISVQSLAQTVGIDTKTAEKYLDLLEKAFIIKSLRPYHKNMHNALRKKSKYYFWDLGIRNALLQQWQPLELRNDIGQLRENFAIMERVKYLEYTKQRPLIHFWRTYSGQEIDYIEESNAHFDCYECKWSSKSKLKIPSQWRALDIDATHHLLNPDTIWEYVML